MQQQFYRTAILLGEEKLEQLYKVHILIAGLGGVGGQVAETIARSGVGKITIIDHDYVDITNINRQLIATLSSVGKSKVELFYARIKDINPDCEVSQQKIFLEENNLTQLIPHDVSYVIDCIDTVPAKIALISYCIKNNIKIASSMGAGNRYDISKVKLGDISKTSMCGLARIVRHKLKQQGIFKGVTVVYSTESGLPPLTQERPLRPINGTISYLPPMFGLMLAGHVLRQLILSIR